MNHPSASVAKGRAFKARPLACFFVIAGLFAINAAPAAAEQPKTPFLTGTNPASPSTASRPLVEGNSDGVVTSAVKRRSFTLGALNVAAGLETKNPGFVITIYAEDGSCSHEAAIVGVGTAAQLEGSGIPLEKDLKPDWETHLYANQTDPESPAEPSECSGAIIYQQVTTPPAPPVFQATVPASPAGENLPNLLGSAVKGATVSIYLDSSCSGAAVASGSAATFAGEGIPVTVSNNTTSTFYAKATLAGLSSACSTSSITYQEVSTEEGPGGGGPGGGEEKRPQPEPPLPDLPGSPTVPKLHVSPQGPANDNTPTVSGKAQGAARVELFSSAGCRGVVLASGSVAQLNEGIQIEVADNSTTTLYGISMDGGGRSQCSSDPVTYVEDSTAPDARITSGPAARTRRTRALFRFADTSGEAGTTFLCRLDHRRWTPCSSPLRLRHLGHRRHVFRVEAEDVAGNRQATAAKRKFRVVGR